jgi:D-3-phosphoglycerate dehydrogenase
MLLFPCPAFLDAVMGLRARRCFGPCPNPAPVWCQVLSELQPYVSLADRLGRIAVQLVSGGAGVKDVRVTYRTGRSADDLDTRLLRAMITKGLIEPVSSAFINLVNADYTAKQRGLRISEVKESVDGAEGESGAPLESIQVDISNVDSKFASATGQAGNITVVGAVKNGVAHLTKIGSFNMDIALEGSLVLCRQQDQPGMIGAVGTIFGRSNINVSFMSVGRTGPRQQAVMAIGVDDEPSKEILDEIAALPAISELAFLKL